MKLHGRIQVSSNEPVVLARLVSPDQLRDPAHEMVLQHSIEAGTEQESFEYGRGLLRVGETRPLSADDGRLVVDAPSAFDYLAPGDIVRVNPAAQHLSVLYRKNSRHNSLLVTERCNSNCIMCSQPPQPADDSFLIAELLEAISLMDPASTAELGITGGEPTLLYDGLLKLIACARDHLPGTALHILSNGRLFAYRRYADQVSALAHPDLVFGVPLYSDLPHVHDFVVQAANAFDQTIRGLLNLARHGVRVEIRIVLHRHTYSRLPQVAQFIARNLPFADHVALMGLEMMGYVKMNLESLWIDPVEYQDELRLCVQTLDRAGLNVSIYNHQLCTLDQELWPFAQQSISDWKNIYLPQCGPCVVRESCGGFFASAKLRHSEHIQPVQSDDLTACGWMTSGDC